jgi:hypothetical protein
MKSVEWKTYRTRFLIQAKQLNYALTFVDPLGRQHCGRKGDYLVESSDGRISIAPRQIFEDIYVPISPLEEEQREREVEQKPEDRKGEAPNELQIGNLPIEPLDITEVKLSRAPVGRKPITPTRVPRPDESARVRRKLPQPCRDRRASPPSRLSLM